jgi:plastocyanin
MQSTWVWVLIAIIILAGGYWWWQTSQIPALEPGMATPTTTTNDTMDTGSGVDAGVSVSVDTTPMTATITYNGTSYSPSTVTIKKGGTVTWVNSSGGQMWVASAQHPTHTVYSGTNRTAHCPDPENNDFDQCAGSTGDFSFKFDKAGSWGYHDHINASAFGKVVVEE